LNIPLEVATVFDFGDLRFRPIEKEDLELMHKWENNSELMMYPRSNPMNFVNMTQLEKKYEEWMKDKKHLRFILELNETKEVIGIARIKQEEWGGVKSKDIGKYIGDKKLWGKGLGQQITVALLEMVFYQLNAERCEAWSVEYNHRAHKTLEACGFRKGGELRKTVFVNGQRWNSIHFDILRDEYLGIRAGSLNQTLGTKKEDYMKKIT
jgi:RimJ/RimL family protein N-acetyltransferase